MLIFYVSVLWCIIDTNLLPERQTFIYEHQTGEPNCPNNIHVYNSIVHYKYSTQRFVDERLLVIFTLTLRDYMHAICAAPVLHHVGNSVGGQAYNVGKVCRVFIAIECGVFIVRKFVHKSDSRSYRIILWDLDDGYKVAANPICEKELQITNILI